MARPHDVSFGNQERLWRRVKKSDLRAKPPQIRGTSLRLQISVVRERHGNRDTVATGDRNGVAEAFAGEVAAVCEGAVRVACVDDPDDADPGHSLIALVATPGDAVSEESINAARAQIALAMTVVVSPTV